MKQSKPVFSVRVLLVLLAALTVLTFASCTGKPAETATTEPATKAPAESVTVAPAESVTVAPAESATAAPAESATDAAESETDKVAREGLWADATYVNDKTFGEGKTTIYVDVVVDGKSVTFTLRTDAETLGAALIAENLIEGEDGQYGLYVKKVNGMTADYDVDGSYWSISKDGELLMTGVDGENISDGAHYALTRTK